MYRLTADKSLPGIKQLFMPHFSVQAASPIKHQDLYQSEVLVCRSTLKVNRNLLENTPIQVVASATSGTCHIDNDYLQKNNISLYSAPGANAPSVCDYVLSIIALFDFIPKQTSIGIIGVGQVGSRLARQLSALGFKVLLNDPPRALKESNFNNASLEQISQCDVISLHVPLNFSGPFKTYQFINDVFLKKMRDDSVFINTSRGEVVDESALLKQSARLKLCLDVFQNEPEINKRLVQSCFIATPHIAGHAIESKLRTVYWVQQKILNHFKITTKLSLDLPATHLISAKRFKEILKIYDPFIESQQFKNTLARLPFQTLRRAHKRHEFYN